MVVSVCQWKLFYSGAYEHVVFGQFILQLYTACGFTNGTGGFFPQKSTYVYVYGVPCNLLQSSEGQAFKPLKLGGGGGGGGWPTAYKFTGPELYKLPLCLPTPTFYVLNIRECSVSFCTYWSSDPILLQVESVDKQDQNA